MRTSAAFHSGQTTISKNSRIFQDVSECSKLRISRICVAMGSLFLNSDSSSLCSSQASKEMGKQSDLREGNLGLPMRHIASTGCALFDIVGSKLETLSLKLLSLPHRCGTPLLSVVFPSFQRRSLLQNTSSPRKATNFFGKDERLPPCACTCHHIRQFDEALGMLFGGILALPWVLMEQNLESQNCRMF